MFVNQVTCMGACICAGRLIQECERAKRDKHVLNGATMVPLAMTTFGTLGPSAEAYKA